MNAKLSSIKKQIFNQITRNELVSKADLMKRFNITSTSLSRLLDELLTDGLIIASELGRSTGGRKPILYCVNPSHRAIFGLEISRFFSAIGLYDLNLKPLAFERWKMDEQMTPEKLVAKITMLAERMMTECGIEREKVIGIGIGAVGPLSHEDGVMLKPRYFPAKGWSNVPICEWLEQSSGLHAVLDNGANTAIIGEHWALRNEEVEHMLYVHAGVGLRTSMMSGGQIVRGAFDMEGSFGQMIIQTNGPRLADEGNYGALEALVSIPALEKRIHSQLASSESTDLKHLPLESIRFDVLKNAYLQEDAFVQEQFLQTASYLGIGIANLINILHPETVILGGPFVNVHKTIYDTVIQVARSNIYYSPHYEPIFSQGELTEDAVTAGAAIMLLQEWDLT
ncbi:putative NBD/HSP70 family sugar kinase [Paenibacillus castaneae]|uniref:ROK family transcriptional regulator n=1 Tax=Paenibacillus castaneae TaxID=474957 RepID=UPI000C9A0C77|nr:ROK family transcriptional regulator [Paenibacillus castaneae]NIK76729.1 putative NBD/HSP70 family sugar kinase [Paenibacillus castaneae]